MVDLVRDKVDAKMSSDGVWVDIANFGRVKVRRWNNRDYRTKVLALRDAKLEELKLGVDVDLPEQYSYPIMVAGACHCVILEWDGVESDGKPIAYTPEIGIQTFSEEEGPWRDEFNAIVIASSERANYIAKRREATLKKP